MKKRVPDKFWFPWWPDKWIFGSVRIEFTPAERGIWVDLLSLASKDDGYIRANEETAYPLDQLAGMLRIPLEEFKKAIRKFIKNKKLTKTKAGTLYITKWDKYQFSDRHKRRLEREMAGNKDTMAGNKDTILNKSTLNNNKLKNKTLNKKRIRHKTLTPKPKVFEDVDIKLTQILINLILKNDPKSKVKRMPETTQEAWLNECRRLREIDKRTPDEIKFVIEWTQ